MTAMIRELPTCEWEHCDGHLGKFDSCRDEALYLSTLDGFDESTGDMDWGSHLTLVLIDEPQLVMMDTLIGKAPFPIPAGAYIVESVSSGAVYVTEYESYVAARQAFDDAARRYDEWHYADMDADELDADHAPGVDDDNVCVTCGRTVSDDGMQHV